MADAKKILGQLAEYLKCKNFRALAAYIGVAESTIYSWVNRGRIGAPEKILDKCKGVRLEWLKTGEGPMLDEMGSLDKERVEMLSTEISRLQQEYDSMPEDERVNLPAEWADKGFSELAPEDAEAAIKLIFTPKRSLGIKIRSLKSERDLAIAGESWKIAYKSDKFTVRELGRLWNELIAANRPKYFPPPELSNVTPAFDANQLRHVPLISWVQAGGFIDPNSQITPGYAEETVPYFGKLQSSGIFALRVKNDSMEPEFREGDIVIVNPDRQAENGHYIVAKNGDHEATLKQLILDGPKVLLKPLNDRYDIIDMTGQEFRIVGVVVFKMKGY